MKILKGIGFWAASCTWGIIMTLVGAIVALALLVTGHKPKSLFGWYVCFEVGSGWGGFSMGPFIVVAKDVSLQTRQHEAGHGLQNIMLGIFMPFIVSIPSAIRYWYRRLVVQFGHKAPWELPPYDSIWFEGWATSLGVKYFG